MSQPYGFYQNEIYLNGLRGVQPDFPMDFAGLQTRARTALSPSLWSYAYGLALGGVEGVVHVLRSILAETDLIMAVDGYPTLADLTPAAVRRVN